MNINTTSFNKKGQAMVETLFVIIIFTAAAFAGIQLCIIAVDDMISNEAAFTAMRSAVVSKQANMQNTASQTALQLIVPHCTGLNNLLYQETKVWNDAVLGKKMYDHSGFEIMKYNTNIRYQVRIMFASLLRPLHSFSFLSGGVPMVSQTARARMIKSPDEAYYYKAFPDADNFTLSDQK
jgi:hypothetical protein